MQIGFTYDLRDDYLAEGYDEEMTAEFDRAETIDAIAGALTELGHTVDRIGRARNLVLRLAAGDRWDLVFNICEGLGGIAREAQVPAILDVFSIPYTFSDALVLSLSLHKGLTKCVIQQAGLPTPKSKTVERLSDLDDLAMEFPLFAKPVAEGTGKGINAASVIRDRDQLVEVCGSLLKRFQQPVLVEAFLPGREFTVALMGTGDNARVLGSMEITLLPEAEKDVYSYQNKENSEELVICQVVSSEQDEEIREAERVALAAWKVLGCRDAGRVDLRSDGKGQPNFMEVNPLAGLHPSHSDLPIIATGKGTSFTQLLGQIVESACQRKVGP